MSRWFPEQAVWRVGLHAGDAQPATLERELDALALRPGTRLTCVLAGEGVRHRIVPWNDELSSPSQRQLLATQCFREAYGEVARDWTVRLDRGGPGAATLACAVDTVLLGHLDAVTRNRRLKLVSVQPSLMHAYNEVRRRLERGLHWFVCAEAAWITLLLTSPAGPLHVRRLRSPGIDLARAIDREWFALGMDLPRCPVYLGRSVDGGGASAWQPLSLDGWPVVDLGVPGSAVVPAIPLPVEQACS